MQYSFSELLLPAKGSLHYIIIFNCFCSFLWIINPKRLRTVPVICLCVPNLQMYTQVVLKKPLLNTKNSNSELSADLRTISHTNLMTHFCGFSLFNSRVTFHCRRNDLTHHQVLRVALCLAVKSLSEQTSHHEVLNTLGDSLILNK